MPPSFLGPAPDPNGAARLRSLNSPTNMDKFGDVLSGLYAGDQTREDLGRSEGLSDHLVSTFDGGPALRALRAAADERRFQHVQDENAAVDDLHSGRPRELAMGASAIGNDVEDANSERGYEREVLPWAMGANDRTAAAKHALAEMQYVVPAQLKAQGDVGAAQAHAQGDVAVQGQKDKSLSVRALYDALNALIAKTGKVPSAEDVTSLQGLYK